MSGRIAAAAQLAAAGRVQSLWHRAGSILRRIGDRALQRGHGGIDRRGPRASAQRPGLHIINPPQGEVGIRRFCLWAIGLAILTVRKIAKNPGFTAGAQVKVSSTAVRMTMLTTNTFVGNDWMLQNMFEMAARDVPLRGSPSYGVRPGPSWRTTTSGAQTINYTGTGVQDLNRISPKPNKFPAVQPEARATSYCTR